MGICDCISVFGFVEPSRFGSLCWWCLSCICWCIMLAPVRSAARPAVRTFSASPWGTDHWRHDKQAFKAWAKEASEPGSSKAKRELYGFLALSFGDVDTNKDGLINAEQFDQLLAEVAALPRRYGLAPLDVGDAVSRAVNHKILFDFLDKTGRGA